MDKFHFTLKKVYKVVFDNNNYYMLHLPESEESEKVRLVVALRERADIDLDKIARIEPCYVLKETQEEMPASL